MARYTFTHIFAVLPVSKSTYDEIKSKLEAAGYQDQFQEDEGQIVIDMHGIAIKEERCSQPKKS